MPLGFRNTLSLPSAVEVLRGSLHDPILNHELAAVVTHAGQAAMMGLAVAHYSPEDPEFTCPDLAKWTAAAIGSPTSPISLSNLNDWLRASMIPAGFVERDPTRPKHALQSYLLTDTGRDFAPAYAGFALQLVTDYPYKLSEIFGGMQSTQGAALRPPLTRSYLMGLLLSREREQFSETALAAEVNKTQPYIKKHLEALEAARLVTSPGATVSKNPKAMYELGNTPYQGEGRTVPLTRLIMQVIREAGRPLTRAEVQARLGALLSSPIGTPQVNIDETHEDALPSSDAEGVSPKVISSTLYNLKTAGYIRNKNAPEDRQWSAANLRGTRYFWKTVVTGMAEILQARQEGNDAVLEAYRRRAQHIVTHPDLLKGALLSQGILKEA